MYMCMPIISIKLSYFVSNMLWTIHSACFLLFLLFYVYPIHIALFSLVCNALFSLVCNFCMTFKIVL